MVEHEQGERDEGTQWAAHDHFATVVTSPVQGMKDEYEQGVERPIGSYGAVTGVYGALAVAAAVVAKRQRRHFAASGYDLLLATIATAKFSRMIAKDPITSFLRAPFTRFKGRAGEAELAEEVRGTGPRHAVGELLTCPFCIEPWTAAAFAIGFTFAPQLTRAAAAVGVMSAGADVGQYGFAGLQTAWKRFSSGEGNGNG